MTCPERDREPTMVARRKRAGGIAALGVLLLSGCGLPPPQLDAETQWHEAMANLGMFGIYPPSEDVMVGDAFLYVPGARYFNLVRVTSAPGDRLAEQFCWQEQDRLALDSPPVSEVAAAEGRARRPGSPGGAAGNVTCPQPRRRGQEDRWDNLRAVAPFDAAPAQLAGRVTRLREAAVPTLEVGRFSQTQVAGGVTSGNIGLALGLGSSSASAVRVDLTQLQSAALEEVRGFRLMELIQLSRLNRIAKGEREEPNALTPLMLARSLWHADNRGSTSLLRSFCDGRFRDLVEQGVRVIVANRVLYAGGVSFDFLSEDVFATRFALDFASALANARQNPQVRDLPGSGAQQGQPPPPPRDQARPAPQGSAALDAELARLARFAGDLLTLPAGGPGQASGRITVGRFGNLALRRDFARPAAVGMGAALHFPVNEAAVPASRVQTEDAVGYCQAIFGGAASRYAALERMLERNRAWIEALYASRQWVPAVRSPADRSLLTQDPDAGRLPPLQPSASIRVRL
jgi:hypothetical protein